MLRLFHLRDRRRTVCFTSETADVAFVSHWRCTVCFTPETGHVTFVSHQRQEMYRLFHIRDRRRNVCFTSETGDLAFVSPQRQEK